MRSKSGIGVAPALAVCKAANFSTASSKDSFLKEGRGRDGDQDTMLSSYC